MSKARRLYELKQLSEAGDAFRDAIAFNPTCVDTYHAYEERILGAEESHFERAGYHEALLICQNALAFNPKSVRAYTRKGEILYALNSYQDAYEAFRTAIQFNLAYVQNRFGDGNIFIERGNQLHKPGYFQDALNFYELAIQIEPSNREAYDGKIRTLAKLGRHEEAQRVKDKLKTIVESQQTGTLHKKPYLYER